MPRAGLSAERVVREAEDVADQVGLAALTLAAVAGRLGVRLPSLYKHVDGMAGLRRDVAVRAKTELAAVLARASVGRSRDDAVIAMARAYRSWAVAHPGRYEATVQAPAADDTAALDASAAAIQVVYDVLGGYGLSGDDAVDATRALRAAMHGFLALETAGGFGLPVDIDRSFDRLVRGLTVAFATWQS